MDVLRPNGGFAAPRAPAACAPAGEAGPFARELDCDASGPALQATNDYRMREGVAAQSGLHLTHTAAARACVGYGGTLLARLNAVPGDANASRLELVDLAHPGLDEPARRPPPHFQRLGFGLTDAVPLGTDGAAHPTQVRLATLRDLPYAHCELLRCEFAPGDQRPVAMVVRRRFYRDGGDGRNGLPPRYQVRWFDLRPLYRLAQLGKTVEAGQLPSQALLDDAAAPQVLTNPGGDDAGRAFVLVDGPPFARGPFNAPINARVQRLDVVAPMPGSRSQRPVMQPFFAGWPSWAAGAASSGASGGPGGFAGPSFGARLHHLTAVACAANGTVAVGVDGALWLRAPTGTVAPLMQLPRPAGLDAFADAVCISVELAAQGRFVAANWRGLGSGPLPTYRAALFYCDFATARVVPLAVPFDPGVDPRFVSLCFAKTDVDEDDTARLCANDADQVALMGGARLARSLRRLHLTDAPRLQVTVGASFANLTQLWRLEYDPTEDLARPGVGHALRVVAQTYATRDREQGALLDEHNDGAGRQLHSSGAARVLLQFDELGHMYPRVYAEQDQAWDNGRLGGGLRPLRLRETRPAVVAKARQMGLKLRQNELTAGPWMSRDGRFLFVGLDGNRLWRWDFAPQENGFLTPGIHEPQLQPYFERPRTENFSVVPASARSQLPFLGHGANAASEVGDPEVDARSREAFLQLDREERPYAPNVVHQDMSYGVTLATSERAVAIRVAPPPQIELTAWGSGLFDEAQAMATRAFWLREGRQLLPDLSYLTLPDAMPSSDYQLAMVEADSALLDGGL